MKNKSTLYAILTVLLIIAIVFSVWFFIKKSSTSNDVSKNVGQDTIMREKIGENESMAGKIPGSYTYAPTKLTLRFDKEYSVRLIQQEDTDVIVIQHREDSNNGFQVAISAWDEDASTLSFERIIKELPELTLEETKTGNLSFGATALSFVTGEKDFKTREVWFVYKNHLYQMSAPLAYGGLLDGEIGLMSFDQ